MLNRLNGTISGYHGYLTTLVPCLVTWMSTMVPVSEYEARLISENSAWKTRSRSIAVLQHKVKVNGSVITPGQGHWQCYNTKSRLMAVL